MSDGHARFDLVETKVEVAGHSWTLRHPRAADALISEEDFARDERLPYWADIWPSARVLADVVARHHGDARPALELGCGSGLVACALAAAGYTVTATDYYPDALQVTRENVRRNCAREIGTELLDWRALPAQLPRHALVVAADVLYERPYGALVAAAIHRTLAHDGMALVADPGRIALDVFVAEAAGLGLAVVERWDTDVAREGQRHTIRLLALRHTVA